jgi:DNA polymerase delta subunit 1
MTTGKSVMHYQPGPPRPFIRVELAAPGLVPAARAICEAGLPVDGWGARSFLTYESHVLYALRYMVDAGIVGGAWVTLPAGKYALGAPPGARGPTTHCQVREKGGGWMCIFLIDRFNPPLPHPPSPFHRSRPTSTTPT